MMKNVIKLSFLIFAILCLSFASCSKVSAPRDAENIKLLRHVYDQTRKETRTELGEGLDCFVSLFGGQPKALTNEEIQQKVVMQEWYFNEECQGSQYTGYWVIYQVSIGKATYYTLISLTEFENGRCEWTIEGVEKTLSRISSYLEY